MSVAPEHDAPQGPAARDPGFRDAVTFAFGDPVAKLYGHARIGVGADGASGLALLFSGSDVVAASTAGGVPLDGVPSSWEDVRVAGVRTDVVSRSWRGRSASSATARASTCASRRGLAGGPRGGTRSARAGGMEGDEQLCAVSGTVRSGPGARDPCLGQRGHIWGAPDWKRSSWRARVGVARRRDAR